MAVSYFKLGETYESIGNFEEVFSYFKSFTNLMKELYEAYPKNVNYKNSLAVSYARLGGFFKTKKEDKKKARLYFEKAQRLWEELVVQAPQHVRFQQHAKLIKKDLENL